jgi:L-ascorbate metabolism protein UlaG (beta-lactamase superfamily)
MQHTALAQLVRVCAVAVAASLIACVVAAPLVSAQVWSSRLAQDPACQSLTPSAAGGPLPKDPNVMVLRYLGVSNYELAYRNVVVLLDAGIDKLPYWIPTGVSAADMTKHVNAILVGHAHGEHIWDAPMIAQKTGALVVTEPIGMNWIRSTGLVPEKQLATVLGLGAPNETFKFTGFTVTAVQGHHNVVPEDYMQLDRAAAAAVNLKVPLTEAQQKRVQELNGRIKLTPEELKRLPAEGTMTYYFTFDNGFRLWYGDSAGPPTDAERQLAKKIPGVDVGLIPYYGGELGIPITMEYVRLFKPAIFLPTHHDGHWSRMLDMPLGPLQLAIREELPKTRAISPLYRTAVCIDTKTKDVYVAN